MRKIVMALWIYVVPIPLFALLFYGWVARTGSVMFAAFCMGLPLIYGYVVPGIATNIMKKWRFRGHLLMGNYYIHHGFKYSSNLNLGFFIVFWGAGNGAPLDVGQAGALCLTMGIVEGFVGWLHDTHSMKSGMLEILRNPLARAGRSPEEVAFSYAPLCFFFIGLTFAVSAVLAYRRFVLATADWTILALYLAAGFAFMTTVTSAVFGLLERSWPTSS